MDDKMKKIAEIGEIIVAKRGETVFQIGQKIDSFFYIQKGIVKIAADSSDGRTATVSLNEAGEFFGYLDYLKGQREFTNYAVALSECVLYSIPIDWIHNSLVRENFIFFSMVQQLDKAGQLKFVLSTMSVPERLRWLLIRMAKKTKGEVLLIETPLTHEEMANYLGCSRQKVSLFLSKWKKDGALSYENGAIKILDEEKMI
ncbi:Crp/Fnr family transcriptional regulator [Ureibacillus sp. FSL K6-8385]|nr:Crp/Fnr family transcriptional regulator [Ureibacillus terrenus]MED3662805.1 Crp/Fnr family transcriptional regulator [Ureibacillus terrenus]MED3763723.1 Crp/Fnr family transcriptional regulator [Ureibacillus terrenus]